MSIFDLSKKPPELSHDWEVFQQFVGNIGAFTYIAKEKSAYLDESACRMLACTSTKLNEFEFFNLLDIRNTNSYYWVTAVDNNQYAVPNYLTGRMLSLSLSASF